MTESNKIVVQHSIFKRLFLSLRLRFTLHEAWVLRSAEKLPLFSLFIFGTLWVWIFAPALVIGIPLVLLIENMGILGMALHFFVGIGGLIIVVPWFCRWYFVCLGLMFGSGTLAQTKEKEISTRLQHLQNLLN